MTEKEARGKALSCRAFVVIGGRHISDRLDVDSNRRALVDLMAGRVVRRGSFSMSVPSIVVFAPDGTRVAVGSEKGEVLIVDPATGKDIAAPQLVHQGLVNGIAFSPDSSLLVSAAFDAGVSLFDGKPRRCSARSPPTRKWSPPISCQMATLSRSPRTTTASITGTPDWSTPSTPACRIAGRDLTAAEWRENFGDRPYTKTC